MRRLRGEVVSQDAGVAARGRVDKIRCRVSSLFVRLEEVFLFRIRCAREIRESRTASAMSST